MPVIYECGICGCYHPWTWNGDCREDGYRFASIEDAASQYGVSEYSLTVKSMDERVSADG